MKRLKLFLLLGPLLVAACAGGGEILRYNDYGDVEVKRQFLETIKGNKSGADYWYTADTAWRQTGKLPADAEMLEESDSDYDIAYTDKWDEDVDKFDLFQAKTDKDDNISEVYWAARIDLDDPDPLLNLRDDWTGVPKQRGAGQTITGLGRNQVVQFAIRAKKLDSTHDEYWNVDDRYALNSRYVITWDRDALGEVDTVKQFGKISDKKSRAVVAGDNGIILDSRFGYNFQLESKGQPAMTINPAKEEDLMLEGCELRKDNGEYYLRINPDFKFKTLRGLQQKTAEQPKKKSAKIRRHYSLQERYPDGYCVVDVGELKCDDSDLYRLCLLDGDIRRGQKKVIVGKNYLRAKGSLQLWGNYFDKVIVP